MATVVTLDVFSGRQNPTWILSEADSQKLVERVNAVETVTAQKPSGAMGGLGYRGFLLNRTPNSVQIHGAMRVHEGIVDKGIHEANLITRDREIESFLLETAPDTVHADVRKLVASEIRGGLTAAPELFRPPLPVKCPKCMAKDAPPYNPAKWNIPTVQPFNNCYNYANDHITNTFAQPGRAHGKMYKALTCAGVNPAAIADGLRNSPNFAGPLGPGKGWYVALVIWPGRDYHWYRQDDVGCWSHKPGSTAARNTDNSGKSITDPKTCDRGPYTVFCNYMITNRGVVIN